MKGIDIVYHADNNTMELKDAPNDLLVGTDGDDYATYLRFQIIDDEGILDGFTPYVLFEVESRPMIGLDESYTLNLTQDLLNKARYGKLPFMLVFKGKESTIEIRSVNSLTLGIAHSIDADREIKDDTSDSELAIKYVEITYHAESRLMELTDMPDDQFIGTDGDDYATYLKFTMDDPNGLLAGYSARVEFDVSIRDDNDDVYKPFIVIDESMSVPLIQRILSNVKYGAIPIQLAFKKTDGEGKTSQFYSLNKLRLSISDSIHAIEGVDVNDRADFSSAINNVEYDSKTATFSFRQIDGRTIAVQLSDLSEEHFEVSTKDDLKKLNQAQNGDTATTLDDGKWYKLYGEYSDLQSWKVMSPSVKAVDDHISDRNNPHNVTKTQLGLGNVDNTSDADKPISTATQNALNLKADKSEIATLYRPKGSVNSFDDLPSNPSIGDVYDVRTDGMNYVWLGDRWDELGSIVNLDPYYKKSEVDSLLNTKVDTEEYNPFVESVDAHISNTSNPHGVTKTQIGLGNVDNTSDVNKPISTATQNALDTKADSQELSELSKIVSEEIADRESSEGIINESISNHVSDTNNPHGVTKSQVGLSNVDNTSDVDKPISTATQEVLDTKADKTTVSSLSNSLTKEIQDRQAGDNTNATAISTHATNKSNPHNVTKEQVGLGNVDNTSDIDKPISTATQDALNVIENALSSHINDILSNPHAVTKDQIGLGHVDNTSDMEKPVSEATRSAIDEVKGIIHEHEINYQNPHNVTKEQIGLGNVDNTPDEAKPISNAVQGAFQGVYESISAHVNDTTNPHEVTKEQVGLSNVDNTSDADKPISTATQEALDSKVDTSTFDGLSSIVTQEIQDRTEGDSALQLALDTHTTDYTNPHQVTKAQVGLSNVDNTSDLNKPISTAVQNALNVKQDTLTAGSNISIVENTISAVDTTYSVVTQTADGLMSSADKTKLDGIESGAQKNTVTGVKGNSESSYRTGNINITKTNIGLGNVDNTSDMDKPISTAVQNALDEKASKSDIAKIYRPCGSVATYNDLPTNANIGDVYDVADTGMNYAWVEIGGVAKWDALGALGENIDMTKYYTKTEIDTKVSSLQTGINGKSHVSVTRSLASGTAIGTVTVDGVDTTLYCQTNSDTKNTAGSTDTSNKLYLIGATTQSANPQTYSHDTAYVGTDGKLYSGGKVVIASGDKATSAGTADSATKATQDASGNVITNTYATKTELSNAVNVKQNTITGGATTIVDTDLTASRALISNSSGKVAVSDITSAELGYLDGVTSNIQTQLNGKSDNGHTHDGRYYTETEVNNLLGGKQDVLTAGENITIDADNTISAKDTTYGVATQSANGLMSKDDKIKLDGVATGANKTVVDTALSGTSTNPVQNKVINSALAGKQATLTAGDNITISGTTISAKDTTYSVATKDANGLMSSTDKSKLDGIATGANKTTVDSALSTTSANPVQNKVVTNALNGKAGTSVATQSANGLMSSGDKTKLDGIATGANKTTVDSSLSSTSTNPVQNKVINSALAGKQATLTAGTNITISGTTISAKVPTKTSELTNDSNYVASTSLSAVATSGSYTDLSNKPTIPTVNNATLTIQKNGSKVATFTANSSSNVTANITVPTVDTSLSSTSTNAISNKAVYNAINYTRHFTYVAGATNVAVSGKTVSFYGVNFTYIRTGPKCGVLSGMYRVGSGKGTYSGFAYIDLAWLGTKFGVSFKKPSSSYYSGTWYYPDGGSSMYDKVQYCHVRTDNSGAICIGRVYSTSSFGDWNWTDHDNGNWISIEGVFLEEA